VTNYQLLFYVTTVFDVCIFVSLQTESNNIDYKTKNSGIRNSRKRTKNSQNSV